MNVTGGFGDNLEEESKACPSGVMSPPISKDIGDILDDLQNN